MFTANPPTGHASGLGRASYNNGTNSNKVSIRLANDKSSHKNGGVKYTAVKIEPGTRQYYEHQFKQNQQAMKPYSALMNGIQCDR